MFVGLLPLLLGLHAPHLLRRPLSATHPRRASSPRASTTSSKDTVEQLLTLAAPTDRGIGATDEVRDEIASLIESLEASWEGTDALSAEQERFLLRNTEVCYVGQSSSKKANAAGGKYRGRVGRLLFRTESLFQHVLLPSVAVNVIQFRLLGLIPGQAVLRGAWRRALDDAELLSLQRNSSRALSPNTIVVEFESPRVAFGREGRVLNLQLGPTSRVGLDCTYLDERIRICRGAGSAVPFVFRADTCADGAPLRAASEQWRLCVDRPPLRRLPVAVATVVAAVGCGMGLLPRVPRWCGLVFAVAAAMLMRSTGGIVVDPPRKASRPTGDAVPVAAPSA